MPPELNNIIKSYSDSILKKGDEFFFIQIGSNDGENNDPIYKFIKEFGWKGILVEPVSYIFEKLKKTYKNSTGLSFENYAIDKADGARTFYRIDKNDELGTDALDKSYQEHLGSFLKEVVERHRNAVPNFDQHFIEEQVKTISLDSLLKKYKVEKIDLLAIDTEGYDYELIKLIPFDRIKPAMILYENKNLSQGDILNCRHLLLDNGYKILDTDSDSFAYQVVEKHDLILNLIKDFHVGAEVGVLRGELSKRILSLWGGKLYMIDAWRHFKGLMDSNNPDNNGQLNNMAYTFMAVYDFGERACIIRDTSVNASILFSDNSLDFVYIDAGHDKKSVMEDLGAWYPKVKDGGMLIGDDYFDGLFRSENKGDPDTLVEVKSTVDTFAKTIGKKVNSFSVADSTLRGNLGETLVAQWWICK